MFHRTIKIPQRRFYEKVPDCEPFLLSRDPTPQMIGPVRAMPWQEGLQALGL